MTSEFSHNPRKNHGGHHVIFVVCERNLIRFPDGFVGLRAERSLVYNPNATCRNKGESDMKKRHRRDSSWENLLVTESGPSCLKKDNAQQYE